MLEGYKTYLTAAAMIAYVLYGYFLGEAFNVELLMEALAIAGLRRGISSGV